MTPDLEAKIERLKMKNASKTLNVLGRLLVDGREMTVWEHDTNTLPRGERKWRYRARAFAREYIRPLAAEADLHPHDFDPKPLLRAAVKAGFQTLLVVPPIGRASTISYLMRPTFQLVLAAEEFTTEDGGLGLLLLALGIRGRAGGVGRHYGARRRPATPSSASRWSSRRSGWTRRP